MRGKVVLITGGGTGIGAACARRFANDGARVAVLGRRKDLVASVAAEVGGLAITGDASSGDEMRVAVATVIRELGGLDALVANAGGHGLGTAVATRDEEWAQARQANLDTAFVAAREALPALIESLETEVARVTEAMNSPEHFRQGAEGIQAAGRALAAMQAKLDQAYSRWNELE